MKALRRFLPCLLLALPLAACGPSPSGLGPDVRRGLAQGASYAERVTRAGRTGTPDDASTIALGYLERVRLGLGSPFRTADYALHDPRLGDDVRRAVAWAILDRALAGQSYEIDPAALDALGTSAAGFRPGSGRYHLQLVEGAVAEATDPRAGELAVRLAYTLAAAEGTVWQSAPRLVAQVAALARDRVLARQDALRLLRSARRQHVDALQLLVRWRADRAFQVEAPRLRELPAETERQAVEVAPELARSIRELGPRLAGAELKPARPGPGSLPLLGPSAARRLVTLSDSAAGPPETPVVVALSIYAGELRSLTGLSDDERAERDRLLTGAVDEERFAAHVALALDRRGEGEPALAAARVGVASALRGYAQEEVWFPGFGGPSARELLERYGVGVSFDRALPEQWRPYYRRMLGQSLADLQRVLPATDFRGLRVRFGVDPLGPEALALHDPRKRIIYLPPATSAGTIAHELAHDLDWQAALERYRVRGDYATDIASRRAHDPLTAPARGLVSAVDAPDRREQYRLAHLRRPAEAFARNVEWFVAAALAREGLSDGYLSSVQDDVLTGYGSVQPPGLSGAGGRDLVEILDLVAPVYRETRDWYLRTYGPGRMLAPFDLVRRVLEAPVAGDAAAGATGRTRHPAVAADSVASGELYPAAGALGFDAIQQARRAALAAVDAWVCRAPGAMYDRRVEEGRQELVAVAASARARGLASRIAGRTAGREGWLWMQRRLHGAPWPDIALDSATAGALTPVADAAVAVDTARAVPAGDPFALTLPADRCSRVMRPPAATTAGWSGRPG